VTSKKGERERKFTSAKKWSPFGKVTSRDEGLWSHAVVKKTFLK